MRVLQVIKGLHKVGGTTTFVGGLSNSLSSLGVHVTIATYQKYDVSRDYDLDGCVSVKNVSAIHADDFDIVHVHGLWDREVFWASRLALKNKLPLVWSPHGMLAPWALKYRWWKKSLPWHLYLKRRLHRASLIHVTAELEREWIEDLGLGPVGVIPLGTEEPICDGKFTSNEQALRVLFVGRIHQVKGLENLVRAADAIKGNSWSIQFRIVGPDDGGYKRDLLRLIDELDLVPMFEFTGPLFGKELSAQYDWCDILVLPSHSENFGGIVIDALAHGKPVVASRKTPWGELSERGCGWWVPNDPGSLASTLAEICSLPRETLGEMGERGRTLVSEKYTWSAVATAMLRFYTEAIERNGL